MLKISDTKIYLTRGDSAYITLKIVDQEGDRYELQEGDVVRCQVRDKANDGQLLFEGQIDIVRNDLIWHIRPEDTAGAEVKSYVWDAQIQLSNGDIFTFIAPSVFKLMDEVTMDNERSDEKWIIAQLLEQYNKIK